MIIFVPPADFRAYPIGTEYTTRDKRKARCKVVDYLIAFQPGDPSKFSFGYVCEHTLLGAKVRETVPHTTIAMALDAEGRDFIGEQVVIGTTKAAA